MAKVPPGVSRAEYERLKADFDQLAAKVKILAEEFAAQRHELKIQFERIAQMQAVLDEERLAGVRSSASHHSAQR